jgi:hypothetical protein
MNPHGPQSRGGTAWVPAFLVLACLWLGEVYAEPSLSLLNGMVRAGRIGDLPQGSITGICAARGEWEPFQAVVTGTAEELREAMVDASDLTGPGGASIPAPIVCREDYVKVAKSTPMASLPPGDYPDALVPQSFARQPLPNQKQLHQPYWLDLHIPCGAAPGDYTGTLTLRQADHVAVSLPYTLRVWAFNLPETPRLRTSIGTVWRRIAEVHGFDPRQEPPSKELADLLDKYYDLLAQHRLSVDQTYFTYPDPETGKLDEAAVEAGMRRQLLDRHASTLGLPIWPDWPFRDPLAEDREAAMAYVAQWFGVLARLHCEDRGYVIMGDLDEPNNAEAYANVRRWGDFFNEVEARYHIRVPLLVTEQPTPDDPWWGRLDERVDIWVAHFSQVWSDLEFSGGRRDIERRVNAGDEAWAYAALVQMPEAWEELHGHPATLTSSHPPVWAIDYSPMNHRILGWLLPQHKLTGLAYWDTLYVRPGVDVWADAGTFQNGDGDAYNGDGSYIYPATKARHGIDAPMASMRLKWLREACDDYDYLMLARDAGLEAQALELARTFARGFGDWDDEPNKMYEARRQIGELLSAKGGSSGP